MGKVREILHLIRVRQWYKGIVIFAPLIFGGKLTDLTVYLPLLIGFFLINLASSVNYVVNDIVDVDRDRHHPEKCKRPLASGALTKSFAIFLIIIITLIVILGSLFFMNFFVDQIQANRFFFMVLAVFFTGFIYNFWLKNIAFVDIISLSIIYIWRTMAGCWLIDVEFSPWLYLVVFQVAMFLSISKRKADKEFCGENANKHKPIFEKYTDELIKAGQNLITVSLFMTYCLYTVLAPITGFSGPELSNNRGFIMMTVPVMIYIIMRFLYLANVEPKIARNPEKAIKDQPLIIAAIILLILIILGNYVKIGWFL